MRQLALDVLARADKVLGVVVVLFDAGRHGEDVRVKDDVFRREAYLFGQYFVRAAANLNFTRAGVGLAHFIKSHHHHRSTVAADLLRVVNEDIHALFHRDRVDDAFTLNALQPLLDHLPFGGVDHDRHAGDVRLTGDQVQETHHRRFGVEHPLIHVDIDNLRAALHLLTGNIQRFAVLLFFDQTLELRGAGNVSTLTHVHKQAVVADGQRLKAGKATGNRKLGQPAWRQPGHGVAHGGDVLRRGAAAAADDVEKSRLGPLADLRRHGVGIQIVFTEGVRQTGVRVRGNVAFRNARQLLHVLAQLVRAQRAVQAEGERVGVAQGVIKRFGGLAGQGTAGGIGDGAGNHDRQVNAQRLELLFHRVNRGLGVESVEYRFNQDQIGTAFHQRSGRFTVGNNQLVKGDITKRRVVDVR